MLISRNWCWNVFLLAVVSVGGLSCGGGAGTYTPPAKAPFPSISSFTASKSVITSGGSTTLTAVFINGTGTCDQGIGAVVSGTPKSASPITDTTYTLTVANESGIAKKSVTVGVVPAPMQPTVEAPPFVLGGQQGYLASVLPQDGCTYSWSITNGTLTAGASGNAVCFTSGSNGSVSLSCTVTNAAGTNSQPGLATSAILPSQVPASVVADMFAQDKVFFGDGGLMASVPDQPGCTFAWSISGQTSSGTIISGGSGNPVTYASGASTGTFQLTANVQDSLGHYASQSRTLSVVADTFLKSVGDLVPRVNFTATTLPNGRILVAGGGDQFSPATNTTQLYDTVTRTWKDAASMAGPRCFHTATLLYNGKVLVTGGSGGIGAPSTSSVEIYDPASDSWALGPPLAFPLQNHTATLLYNGMVLVVGMSTGNSVALYDPWRNIWIPASPMAIPRTKHTATLLADGRVLVAGGDNGSAIASTEIYDPALNAWQTVTPMEEIREQHSALLLQGGRVLVTGGTSATAEIYDPATDTWSYAASMAVMRRGHTMTLMADGSVLVVGGDIYRTLPTPMAELYDPSANAWTNAGALSAYHTGHVACRLANGKVWVSGGSGLSSTEEYDPSSKTWSSSLGMATARQGHSATSLSSGKVLVVGGMDSGGNLFQFAELYDPITGSWRPVPGPATPRILHSAVLLPDGRVLIAGGADGAFTPLSSAELFDPASESWTSAGDMSWFREGPDLVVLASGKVLVIGAEAEPLGYPTPFYSTADLYDPTTNTWSSGGSLSALRIFDAAILLSNGKVLVAGGSTVTPNANAASSLATCQLYDPTSNTWGAAASMSIPRSAPAGVLLPNGKVLIAGGFNTTFPATYYDSSEIYDPANDSWSVAASLAVPRGAGRSSVLGNGKVLLVGGQYMSNLGYIYPQTGQIYDPAQDTWSVTDPWSVFRSPSVTVTPLPNGKLLCIGGLSSVCEFFKASP